MTSLHRKICEIFSDSRPIIISNNKPYYVDGETSTQLEDPLFVKFFQILTDISPSRRKLDLVSLQTQFQNDIKDIANGAKVPFNILEECFYPHDTELRGMYDDALAYALQVLIDLDHKNDQKYVLPEQEHGGYARGITPSQNVLFPRMIALAKVMKYYAKLQYQIRYGDLKIGGKKSRSKKRGRKSVHRRKKSSHKKRKSKKN